MFRLTGHLRMSYCEAGWTGTSSPSSLTYSQPNLSSCVMIIVFRILVFPFFAGTLCHVSYYFPRHVQS